MNTPNIVTEATAATSKALNWKTLLFMVIATVVVTLIVSYILKNEVVIYDNQGNETGKGEIKPKLKLFSKK